MARVVENRRAARHLAQNRGERLRPEQPVQAGAGISLEELFARMQEGAVQDANIVLKGDVDAFVEAAVSKRQKIQHPGGGVA